LNDLHCVVTVWSPPGHEQGLRELIGILMRANGVEAVPGTYVVPLLSLDWYEWLVAEMERIAQRLQYSRVLVSPAMSGGRYRGWLTKETWPVINSRVAS
jgi:hypothetical protein